MSDEKSVLDAYAAGRPHPVAANIIGKTVRAVASRSGEGDCYDLRIEFTNGSELRIEGGLIGGEIRIGFAG